MRKVDPEALDAAVETLRRTMSAPVSEGTVEELFVVVQMTFHDHVANVLAQPLEDANTLALHAAIHGRVIIDLLTAISIAKWRQEGVDLSHFGADDAKVVAERWIEMIVEIARCEEDDDDDPPQLSSPVQYVRKAAQTLAAVARILDAEHRGLDSPPDEDPLTFDDAAASLVWCAAAAVCIVAALKPEFRVAHAPLAWLG